MYSKMGRMFSDIVMGSEFGYFSDSIDKNTIILANSQNGETVDVMDGVRQAKENGAKIFSLVNVVGSSLARVSDRVLNTNCGPQIRSLPQVHSHRNYVYYTNSCLPWIINSKKERTN